MNLRPITEMQLVKYQNAILRVLATRDSATPVYLANHLSISSLAQGAFYHRHKQAVCDALLRLQQRARITRTGLAPEMRDHYFLCPSQKRCV